MNIYEKLLAVQTELKAPKGQYNSFGKYKYRSCEDILEAVKPLLAKFKATVYIEDTVEVIGERYYIKASVHFVDAESAGDRITTTAFAREEETKKGMDGSQVTGASSSYARKYALNGMFDIDDTKDSDCTNTHGNNAPDNNNVTDNNTTQPKAKQPSSRELLIAKLKEKQIDVNVYAQEHNLTNKTTEAEFQKLLQELEG